MKQEFSVGDKVRVVLSGFGCLDTELGKEYIVEDYDSEGYGGDPGVILSGFRNPGFNGFVGIQSLKLVSTQQQRQLRKLAEEMGIVDLGDTIRYDTFREIQMAPMWVKLIGGSDKCSFAAVKNEEIDKLIVALMLLKTKLNTGAELEDL